MTRSGDRVVSALAGGLLSAGVENKGLGSDWSLYRLDGGYLEWRQWLDGRIF
jgi:hypothetical protein